MQVWLFLCAVAKYFQFTRVRPELLNKIINNAMCGAAANDVWKSANPGSFKELFYRRANDPLRRQFHCSVIGNWKKRSCIFCENVFVLSINCRTGRKHNLWDFERPHHLENIVGRHEVR